MSLTVSALQAAQAYAEGMLLYREVGFPVVVEWSFEKNAPHVFPLADDMSDGGYPFTLNSLSWRDDLPDIDPEGLNGVPWTREMLYEAIISALMRSEWATTLVERMRFCPDGVERWKFHAGTAPTMARRRARSERPPLRPVVTESLACNPRRAIIGSSALTVAGLHLGMELTEIREKAFEMGLKATYDEDAMELVAGSPPDKFDRARIDRDDHLKAREIRFSVRAINRIFKARSLSPRAFAERFIGVYDISDLQPDCLPLGQSWKAQVAPDTEVRISPYTKALTITRVRCSDRGS